MKKPQKTLANLQGFMTNKISMKKPQKTPVNFNGFVTNEAFIKNPQKPRDNSTSLWPSRTYKRVSPELKIKQLMNKFNASFTMRINTQK